jgi:hypothetical protein
MSRNQRLVLLGLAAAVLVVAVVVAATGGSDSTAPTPATTTTAPTNPSGSSTATTRSTETTAPVRATVVVRDAKPVGGVQKFTFKKGGTIDLTVKSDTADEIHFHGYDVAKEVAAGGTVRFRFPATIDGRFVVELERHGETLANVSVEP